MTTTLQQNHRIETVVPFRQQFSMVANVLTLPQRYTPRRIEVFERYGLFSRAEAVTLGEVRDGLLTQAERYRTLQDKQLASWHPFSAVYTGTGAIEDQQTLSLAAIPFKGTESRG